jgi:glycogen debranching enzyme
MHEPQPTEVVIEGGSPERIEPWDMPNRSMDAPDLLPYLLPGEKIITVTQMPRQEHRRQPSGLREILRLTDSESSNTVGDNGPAIAATSLDAYEERSELHLYEAVFGRDSLRVAADLLNKYPKLAKVTLLKLASLQGMEWNAEREEEPGRIPHEIRDPKTDPVAQELSETRGWDWPYYGSVDATPQFLRVLTAYCRQEGKAILGETFTAKDGNERTMQDALGGALSWLEQRMGANTEGLVEFKSTIPGGIENQVWRDSWDGFFHADGALANHDQGVASVDVQRVTYDALLDVAELYAEIPGKQGEAKVLRTQAAGLKHQIMKLFWVEEQGGFFALGTDRDQAGNLRPLAIKTSDMGHLLHSQLLSGDDKPTVRKREALVRQLFSPEMLAVGGIRTLAKDEKRFRPGAYHNGSVWLWDNYLIAQGLRQQGYRALARELDKRINNDVIVTSEFPEYIRGGDEKKPTVTTRVVDIWDEANNRINRIEQPPQEVQAWSVAALLAIRLANKRVRGKTLKKPIVPSAFEAEILEQIAR